MRRPSDRKQVLSTSKTPSLALRFMQARTLQTYSFEYLPPASGG